MKKYILMAGLGLAMSSCLNDEFMELYPQDQQTVISTFKSYDSFKTYAWGFYDVFSGYGNGQTDAIFSGDIQADNMIKHVPGNESAWAYQKVHVPASSGDWDYGYIRKVNLMLDNIDSSEMGEAQKAHWRSVAYFFRSFKYFSMMSLYGDIPWVEHVLNDNSEELYAPRDSRDMVAKNILDNLKYAEEHIKVEGDGENTINRTIVRAFISRFGLFEGTWRKYHNLPDAEVYLKEAARAAKAVLETNNKLHPKYDELFNSESLKGVDGILLYKEYATNWLCHGLTRMVRTAESTIEATKDAVDSYLCTDGRPIGSSEMYAGDKDVYDQFRNRDYRLYHVVCPPYTVKTSSPKSTTWEYTSNEKEREFIDLMASISAETFHRLPTSNFKDFVTKGQPHFKNMNWGQGWNASQMGFWVWKYYNTHTEAINANGVCTTDAPLFRLAEVMLNYAEASYELGQFTQKIADLTINKLRQRANVKAMNVAEIGADFDPARDQSVEPVLWEIRRERRVEFMGENFRMRDLRRWKKGEYVNKWACGVYVKDAKAKKVKVMNGPSDNEGYVYFFAKPLGWQEYYYLHPLPLNQMALNPALTQNPGWEDK